MHFLDGRCAYYSRACFHRKTALKLEGIYFDHKGDGTRSLQRLMKHFYERKELFGDPRWMDEFVKYVALSTKRMGAKEQDLRRYPVIHYQYWVRSI